MRRSAIVMGVCLALAFASAAGGKIIYVDDDAPPGGDGKSWVTAYRYLQDALQEGQPLPSESPAANPPTQKGGVRSLRLRTTGRAANASDSAERTEIRVAQGVYKPDRGIRQKAGDRLATFQLASGLALKGAYAGIGAPDPNARDRKLYETLLSGDLTGNDIPVNDPCDLWREPSQSENAYHVVTASGTDANTLLEGFTITAGNAYEYNYHPQAPNTHNSGGGLKNDAGSLWVRDCTFLRNVAEGRGGGGICNRDGAWAHVIDCEFLENAAREGGGVFNEASEASFQNCLLQRNWSFSAGTGMCNDTAKVDCQRCSFVENDGGSASAVSHVSGSQGKFAECQFIANSAKTLGALVLGSRCDVTAVDCVFHGNEAGRNGGAVFVDTAFRMTLERCSFSQNKATSGGAIYVSESPYHVYEKDVIPLSIRNCPFSEN
jgi:predicted outer membrane repeat protein